MVVGVARSMHSTDGSTIDGEGLTVYYGLLGSAGRVLVYRIGETGIEAEEVGDTA